MLVGSTLGFMGFKWSGALSFIGSWFSSDNSVKDIGESTSLQDIRIGNAQIDVSIAEMQSQQIVAAPIKAKHERAMFASNPSTSLGMEFKVNTNIWDGQLLPMTTSLTDGKFVIVWEGYGQGDDYGIYGQLYNEDCTSFGSEFRINTYINYYQHWPSIAALSDNKFVVVWQSQYQDENDYGIFGQIYNGDGSAYGGEFQVNTYTLSIQKIPTVTGLPEGKFIVVWDSAGQDSDSWGIYAKIYNANGTIDKPEFRVNTYTTLAQEISSVASLLDGKFVIVWDGWQEGSNEGIYGQIYNANATLYGSEFHINTYTNGTQSYPTVMGLSDGKFVVTWQSCFTEQEPSDCGLYGQLFYADGMPCGMEFGIDTYKNGSQGGFNHRAVAKSFDGKYMVIWQSYNNNQDGSGFGVYGQMFYDNGTQFNTEFQINDYAANAQNQPAITGLRSGNFLVVWQSSWHDGYLEGVYGRIIRFYPPEIGNNKLRVQYKGENVQLTETDLNASCLNTPPNEIVFVPSSISGGGFQIIPTGGPQENFTLEQIKGGYVLFAHNGSDIAPAYNITIHVGDFIAGPFAADIEFKGEDLLPPSGNKAGIIAGLSLGAVAILGGSGFFAYQKHKLRESIKLTAIDRKMLVKATALKLLGICDRASDTRIIKDYVASVEQVIDALGQQGIEINFAAGAKSEIGIANLAIAITHQIKPYIKRHVSCGFFGRKLEKLNTEWIIANIGVIAESIKQDLSRHRHGTKDIQELQVIQTTHTATATIENI